MVTGVGDGSIFIYPFVFRFLPRPVLFASPSLSTFLSFSSPPRRSLSWLFFAFLHTPFLRVLLISLFFFLIYKYFFFFLLGLSFSFWKYKQRLSTFRSTRIIRRKNQDTLYWLRKTLYVNNGGGITYGISITSVFTRNQVKWVRPFRLGGDFRSKRDTTRLDGCVTHRYANIRPHHKPHRGPHYDSGLLRQTYRS